MAGEYDEKFDKLTGLVQKVVGRVDELQLDVRDMRSELRDNTSRLSLMEGHVKSLGEKVTTLSGQFSDVAGMAIKDHPRIDTLEERVDVLEAEVH